VLWGSARVPVSAYLRRINEKTNRNFTNV